MASTGQARMRAVQPMQRIRQSGPHGLCFCRRRVICPTGQPGLNGFPTRRAQICRRFSCQTGARAAGSSLHSRTRHWVRQQAATCFGQEWSLWIIKIEKARFIRLLRLFWRNSLRLLQVLIEFTLVLAGNSLRSFFRRPESGCVIILK